MKKRWMIILSCLPFISSCITTSFSLKQKEADEVKTFIAFSLNAARAHIKKAEEGGRDFRESSPEVYRFGYMAKPVGLIFDSHSGDTIIIGEKTKTPKLFLDDFICALRSLYLYGAYPQLTIDPSGNTPESKWHQVKMTKAIESTRFGRVLFEGDYLLKKISLNLVKIKPPKFKTYYHLFVEERQEDTVYSRFWFKPSGVDVLVSKNIVFINKFPVQVFSETLYPKHLKDKAAIEFSQAFSRRFDEFAKYCPVLEDLENLLRWVCITGSVSHMENAPDFKFWLSDYRIKKAEIPERVKGLNNIYGDLDSVLRVSGGVDSTFLNLRLKAKDVAAPDDLVNLVVNSRPSYGTLTWEFSFKEPDSFMGWYTKATVMHDLGRYKEALTYYDEALKLDPQDFTAWYNKGEVSKCLGRAKEAVEAYEMFIKLAPVDDADIKRAKDKILRR